MIRFLFTAMAALLVGCTDISVRITDPVDGLLTDVTVKGGLRRVAVSTSTEGITTIVAGPVAINDATQQVLVKEAVPILTPKGN